MLCGGDVGSCCQYVNVENAAHVRCRLLALLLKVSDVRIKKLAERAAFSFLGGSPGGFFFRLMRFLFISALGEPFLRRAPHCAKAPHESATKRFPGERPHAMMLPSSPPDGT